MLVSGVGCSTVDGDFTVHELRLDPFSGRVAAADITFEQHCNGARPVLRGSVRFQASDLSVRDYSSLQLPRPPEDTPVDPPVDPPVPPVEPPIDPRVDPPVAPPSGAATAAPSQRAPPLPLSPMVRALAPDLASIFASRRRFCRLRVFADDHIRLGTARGDRMRGDDAMDLVFGRGGEDQVAGGAGSDCIDGGPGQDAIHGGPGADVLIGERGPDVIVGGPGRDRIDCGPGRDVARVSREDTVRNCERVIGASA